MQSRAEISARVEVGPDEALVVARDGSDAHLRLTVLLALQAPPSKRREEALSPQTSWPARLAALTAALEVNGARKVVVVDLDSLWVDPREGSFDDGSSAHERRQFFDHVIDLGREHRWRFVRPNVERIVTEKLSDHRVPGDVADSEWMELPTSLQPIARWMRDERFIDDFDLRELLSTEDPQEALLGAFEGLVGPAARDALRRLSLLREVHPLNGVAGPFSPTAEGELSIQPKTLARLRASGALGTAQGGFWIPAPLRARMARRHTLVEPDRAWALRGSIAQVLADGAGASILEAHRQAVLVGDLPLARRTARHFVTELRSIARTLSQRGQASRPVDIPLLQQAADVYAEVVRHDDQDAYAWHYLAYNLEKAKVPEPTRIEEAYQRACSLTDEAANFNPLYHGRRLAFLAQQGQDIRAELTRLLNRTVGLFRDRGMASWLVVNARKGMQKADRADFERDHPWTVDLKAPQKTQPADEV